MHLGAHFLESTLGPPEHKKLCVDISLPRCIGMHYMTHKSYRMQKHRFSITCPCALFVEYASSHRSMKNSVSMFHSADALEYTT
jgi:hypothetical protein